MTKLEELKEFVSTLSLRDRQELFNYLDSLNDDSGESSSLEDVRFSSGIYCPKCGCMENVVKFGKYRKLQRYKCKDCGSTFTAKTNSIFYKSTKSMGTWKKYVDCLRSGLSIRKSAGICNLSIATAFYWRHKILAALRKYSDSKQDKLKGIVESDETYFRVSYKGANRLPDGRLPHKRGEKASKRGLSKEQVCVACGLDRHGMALSRMSNLGKVSSAALARVYSGRVEKDSIFCTDSEKAYVRFANQKGYRLVQIEHGKHRLGVYHINHVNAFHNNLKHFMDRFRGVSTKHLDNYLTWNLHNKLTSNEIIDSIGGLLYSGSCRKILNKPEIPVNLKGASDDKADVF